jgi:hypothetical protein
MVFIFLSVLRSFIATSIQNRPGLAKGYCQNIENTLTKGMKNGPLNTWLESKNAVGTDLPFLNLLKSEVQFSVLDRALEKFEVVRPSFSEGVKILELVTENILMSPDDNSLENVFENSQSVQAWMKHLNTLRYPMTSARDSELESKMLALPWPYGSKTKFERRGDRSGVELKLFVSSEADLTKIISSLERVKANLQVGL